MKKTFKTFDRSSFYSNEKAKQISIKGMAAYSLDLRERIFDAVERGLGTRSEVASMFGVHEFFVYELLRQKRQRSDLAPLPHGGGGV